MDVLKVLKPHHVQKLFADSPVGDEALFESNLERWKAASNVDVNTFCNTKLILEPSDQNHLTVNKDKYFSVKQFLDTTKSGKMIQKYYIQHNILHEEQRNLLVNTIANFLQENGFECSIAKCSTIQKEICSIFPTEKEVSIYIYYVFQIFLY